MMRTLWTAAILLGILAAILVGAALRALHQHEPVPAWAVVLLGITLGILTGVLVEAGRLDIAGCGR